MHRKPMMAWPALLPVVFVCLALMACGGFQLRSTPTATPAVQVSPRPTAVPPSSTPTPPPTPTSAMTATPSPAATAAAVGLAPGRGAKVAAVGGINVRDKAGTVGKQVGRLDSGVTVTIKDGPVDADGYTWWKVDNGAGLSGWVASGPKQDPWLLPATAPATAVVTGDRLVQRPIKVGDRVQVTTEQGQMLTVREEATKSAKDMAHSLSGQQFTVRGGPVNADGLVWWQIEGDAVKGWAAEGDGTNRWLTPIER